MNDEETSHCAVGACIRYPQIDFQDLSYYSAPKKKSEKVLALLATASCLLLVHALSHALVGPESAGISECSLHWLVEHISAQHTPEAAVTLV